MKVLIMAGGTGGHVFPALAIATALKNEGHEILWLGTRGRMEEKLVPKYGFDIRYIDVRGIRGNGLKIKLKAPFMLIHALSQALRVIREFKPDVALGMGGYASGPGGVACKLKGIPLCLHEQNAAAGLTNRLLFKIATRVLLGFEGAFEGSKVSVVGNPVRAEITALHGAKHDFKRDDVLHLLVVGGSLGARYLNEHLPLYFKTYAEKSGARLCVTHQCGAGNQDRVAALYADAPFKATVSDFIHDMREVYAKADLIVCRAGALTVAELTCAGVPPVFVPLPTAVDDHQTKNALSLVKAGAAKLIAQSELSEETLSATLNELNDREVLERMSQSLYASAHLDATARVCQVLKEIAGV